MTTFFLLAQKHHSSVNPDSGYTHQINLPKMYSNINS